MCLGRYCTYDIYVYMEPCWFIPCRHVALLSLGLGAVFLYIYNLHPVTHRGWADIIDSFILSLVRHLVGHKGEGLSTWHLNQLLMRPRPEVPSSCVSSCQQSFPGGGGGGDMNMEKQMSNFIRMRPPASQNAPRKTGGNELMTYRTFLKEQNCISKLSEFKRYWEA